MNITFSHTTPTTPITIDLKSALTPSRLLVKYEDQQRFARFCQGCPNFGAKWSCPPDSPSYTDYAQTFPYCLLLLVTCDLSQFHYVKTEYMKVKASHSVLKAQADKLARFLETALSGKMLASGSCKLCKHCAKKEAFSNCRKPSLRRYSMEALGLNVAQISLDFFQHTLRWYENKLSPPYSSLVFGVLTSQDLDVHSLRQLLEGFYSEKLL